MSFGGLVGVALLLVVFSRAEVGLVDQLGHSVRDGLVPVMAVMASPNVAIDDGLDWIGSQFALAEENERLRAQVERLLTWQAAATRLEVENAALRDVLNAQRQQPRPITRTARVVADSRSPFVHTRLIDAGAAQQIENGMAALGSGGLAGRVVDVGHRSARLLLLTDLNSRIPVLILPARDAAILTGDNGATPRLDFLPLTPQVDVGDRVVTSGAAGVLPAGIAVGKVVRDPDGTLRVRPTVDWGTLHHVRLVRVQPLERPADGGTRPGTTRP